ncbi:MAG: hypothetical protein HY263_10520 [Chloroflexi bacterium]|nr:hypothetical protein [Chloroflexota bacterium]
MTLVTEALATLQEAERLLGSLPDASSDHDAVALLAADLRDLCDSANGNGSLAGSSLALARETIYSAQAHLRILRSRHPREDVSS